MVGTGCAKRFKHARRLDLSGSFSPRQFDVEMKVDEKKHVKSIQDNIKAFGLTDYTIAPVIEKFRDYTDTKEYGGERTYGPEMLMSQAARLRFYQAGTRLILILNEKDIGEVTSDGCIHLKVGSVVDVLGWRFATDGGINGPLNIKRSSLENLANMLIDIVKKRGITKKVFFDEFNVPLEKMFVYENTTRFGDGYLGAKTILWKAATREIGAEHPGYPFMY
jgi:hypothetical protein